MGLRRVRPIRPRIASPRWVALLVVLAASRGDAQSLSVSGPPGALRINGATAGSAPTQDTDASSYYTVRTTSGNPQRITAKLNATMPAGTSLKINLAAVTGSVGVGNVTLNTNAKTVLTNITTTSTRNGTITYTLTATTAAGVVSSRTRTVTFTLVDYP